MSSAGIPPDPPRPSVFISYASEDRAAARELRDLLTAAGLDVWYDEKELGGGDAWDQKIRRQIRECDYFMPLISAATERRKEGYFRREWRLATERTLDMADDVLFLVPIVIDDTAETAARVPERFFAVQWLRAPGGQRTPALDALARRMLLGDHKPMPRARGGAHAMMTGTTRPPGSAASAGTTVPPFTAPPFTGPPPSRADDNAAPPPMPLFPHPPEGGVGHWFKFFAEVIWWFVTATWIVVMRFPRWLRIVLAIWVLAMLVSMCGRNTPPSRPKPPERSGQAQFTGRDRSEIQQAVKAATDQVRAAIERETKEIGRGDSGSAKRRSKTGFDANAAGKPLVLVPFGRDSNESGEATRFANAVFVACSDKLFGSRPADVAITQMMPPTGTEDGLFTVGRNLGAGHVLGAKITTTDSTRSLVVRLIRISDGSVLWTGTHPIETGHAAEVGAKIAEAVIEALPPPSGKKKNER